MDRLRIYVFGFAHSGTTILRKIIGDHPDVYDYIKETYEPPVVYSKPHVVFKYPLLPDRVVHWGCKNIMIMKNPYDIFGGYYLRYGKDYLSIKGHTIGDYCEFARYFMRHTDDYKIKYEDLFKEGEIEKIFDWLGLEFKGIKERKVYCSPSVPIPKEKPDNQREGEGHGAYRTWQVNQTLRDMTGESAKFLPEDTLRYLRNHPTIKELYD